jgi:hypothetical protein
LVDLVMKPMLNHLNLSLTSLPINTIGKIMLALGYARSLQSIHFSSKNIDEIKKTARQVIGEFLFDKTMYNEVPSEIPDDWNAVQKLPHPEHYNLGQSLL